MHASRRADETRSLVVGVGSEIGSADRVTAHNLNSCGCAIGESHLSQAIHFGSCLVGRKEAEEARNEKGAKQPPDPLIRANPNHLPDACQQIVITHARHAAGCYLGMPALVRG